MNNFDSAYNQLYAHSACPLDFTRFSPGISIPYKKGEYSKKLCLIYTTSQIVLPEKTIGIEKRPAAFFSIPGTLFTEELTSSGWLFSFQSFAPRMLPLSAS